MSPYWELQVVQENNPKKCLHMKSEWQIVTGSTSKCKLVNWAAQYNHSAISNHSFIMYWHWEFGIGALHHWAIRYCSFIIYWHWEGGICALNHSAIRDQFLYHFLPLWKYYRFSRQLSHQGPFLYHLLALWLWDMGSVDHSAIRDHSFMIYWRCEWSIGALNHSATRDH